MESLSTTRTSSPGAEVWVGGPDERLRHDTDHTNDAAAVVFHATARSHSRGALFTAADGALVLVLITAGAPAIRRRTRGRSN